MQAYLLWVVSLRENNTKLFSPCEHFTMQAYLLWGVLWRAVWLAFLIVAQGEGNCKSVGEKGEKNKCRLGFWV